MLPVKLYVGADIEEIPMVYNKRKCRMDGA